MRWLRRWPYTLTWSSPAWGGSGTLTWSIRGTVKIYYGQSPQGGVSWSAEVVGQYGTYASGGWDLKPTSWPKPPNPHYVYICKVSGSGSVSNVDGGGSVTIEATVSCQLKPSGG